MPYHPLKFEMMPQINVHWLLSTCPLPFCLCLSQATLFVFSPAFQTSLPQCPTMSLSVFTTKCSTLKSRRCPQSQAQSLVYTGGSIDVFLRTQTVFICNTCPANILHFKNKHHVSQHFTSIISTHAVLCPRRLCSTIFILHMRKHAGATSNP